MSLGCVLQVRYDQLIVQPLELLGWPLAALPPLVLQLPTQQESVAGAGAAVGSSSLAFGSSSLMTTYLDADTRVARAQHGELYLFKRE